MTARQPTITISIVYSPEQLAKVQACVSALQADLYRLGVAFSASTHPDPSPRPSMSLDSRLLEPLVDAVQPIRRPLGEPGRPRQRPAKLHADKGYDFPHLRQALRRRGIVPRIARRRVDSSDRLGRFRWVVERTQGWVVGFPKLAIRYDRQAASVLAFLHLACALICLRFLASAEADAH